MSRKFLLMIAAVCGAVVLLCILILPVESGGQGDASWSRNFIEAHLLGVILMLFGVFAALYSALLYFGKTSVLGMDEGRAQTAALLAYGLGAFFGLAALIAGLEGTAVGFWLFWIACLVGTFVMLMTASPALAKRIADAAKSDETSTQAPAEEKAEGE